MKHPVIAKAELDIKKNNLQLAKKSLRKFIKNHPKNSEALHVAGKVEFRLGDYQKSIKYLKKAAILNDGKKEIYHDIAVVYANLKDNDSASSFFSKALKIDSCYIESLNGLSGSLMEIGDLDGAEACAKKAINLDEDNYRSYGILGTIFRKTERYYEALQCYSKSFSINPEQVNIYNMIGITLGDLGEYDNAAGFFVEGLKKDQKTPEIYVNYAEVMKLQGKFDEAMGAYKIAINLWPSNDYIKWNMSHLLLSQGKLDLGWKYYGYGVDVGARGVTSFNAPEWDGEEDLSEKIVGICAEQGVGDEITFASCFSDVIDKAKQCVISCDYRLKDIFHKSFPSAIIYPARGLKNEAEVEYVKSITHPPIDVQIYAGNLPRYFRRQIDSFPRECAYLSIDDDLKNTWERRLGKRKVPGDKLKVGISWTSGLKKATRMRYYMELRDMMKILSMESLEFYNLQYGDHKEELKYIYDQLGISIKSFDDLNYKDDFDGVAALISNLDLVISPATSVAALSGSLGVATLVYTLPGTWATCGTNSMPWFPCSKLYVKQDESGWDGVITRMIKDINDMANKIDNDSRK